MGPSSATPIDIVRQGTSLLVNAPPTNLAQIGTELWHCRPQVMFRVRVAPQLVLATGQVIIVLPQATHVLQHAMSGRRVLKIRCLAGVVSPRALFPIVMVIVTPVHRICVFPLAIRLEPLQTPPATSARADPPKRVPTANIVTLALIATDNVRAILHAAILPETWQMVLHQQELLVRVAP